MTALPFYLVIWATQRSSHLKGKGGTFNSQLILIPGYISQGNWESNLWSSCNKSTLATKGDSKSQYWAAEPWSD